MKWSIYVLAILLAITTVPFTASANVTPLSVLNDLEDLLYGDVREGSLIDRVTAMELDIYGTEQTGAVMVRIDRMYQYLQSSQATQGSGSLMLQLNMAEWAFLARINSTEPLMRRLINMEMSLLGEEQ